MRNFSKSLLEPYGNSWRASILPLGHGVHHDCGRFSKITHRDRAASRTQVRPRWLWWDARGDWTRAHESAQQDEGTEGSWVHAYLHRKEGDQGNAAYWYNRAGKPVCGEPLHIEWLGIVNALLG